MAAPSTASASESARQPVLQQLPSRGCVLELSSSPAGSRLGSLPSSAFVGRSSAPPPSYRSGGMRFLILLANSLMLFGAYYNFDLPSSCRRQIMQETGISDSDYGILAGMYAYPNTVLPLFGGVMIDRIGVGKSVALFVCLAFLGQCIFAYAMYMRSFHVLLLGRLVFGFGGECLNVANSTLMTQWFRGKELAFALGSSLTVSRLGSVAVFNAQPLLIQHIGIVGGFLVGVAMCCWSILMSFVSWWIDHRADVVDALNGVAARHFEADGPVNFGDIRTFGRQFWLLCYSCVFTYVAIFPFYQVISTAYLESPLRFAFSFSTANFLSSVPVLLSACLSPFFTIVLDRVGKRPQFLALSSGGLCLSHLTLALWPTCHGCAAVFAVYVVVGMSVTMYGGSIWPCFPYTVAASKVGTAFGIAFAIQNMGLALAPMLVELLMTDPHTDYSSALVFVGGSAGIGLACSVAVWRLEKNPDFQCGLELGCSEELESKLLSSPKAASSDLPTLPCSPSEDMAHPLLGAATPPSAVTCPSYQRHIERFAGSPRANHGFRLAYYQRLGLGH